MLTKMKYISTVNTFNAFISPSPVNKLRPTPLRSNPGSATEDIQTK